MEDYRLRHELYDGMASPAMSKMAGGVFIYMSINVEIQKNIFTDFYFSILID